jgi:transcription termination/antitermination protein NusG
MDRFTHGCTTWNAVYTKPHYERKVAEILSKKNIQNYLPVKAAPAPWWLFKRDLDVPLFDSIVFVKVDEGTSRIVKNIDGVVNLLYWLGKPVEIKDFEINRIKGFLSTHSNITAERITVGIEQSQDQFVENVHDLKIDIPELGYRLIAEAAISNVRVITFDSPATPINTPYSHAS